MLKKNKKKNVVKLDRRKGLYLKDTKHKGRGMFCVDDIKSGEVLEITPAIPLREKETDQVDNTILVDYTFSMPGLSKKMRERARIKKASQASGVVMGIVSFCNHSEEPNADVLYEERGGTLYYILKAIKRIPKNTEICTSYGGGWFDDRK